MKKRFGFSLAELMIVFVIATLIVAASVPIISKKHFKMPGNVNHGTYLCYYKDGKLYQKTTSNTTGVFAEDPAVAPGEEVDHCVFTPPQKVNFFQVFAVGGGGGGGDAGYKGGNLTRGETAPEYISPFNITQSLLTSKKIDSDALNPDSPDHKAGKLYAYARAAGSGEGGRPDYVEYLQGCQEGEAVGGNGGSGSDQLYEEWTIRNLADLIDFYMLATQNEAGGTADCPGGNIYCNGCTKVEYIFGTGDVSSLSQVLGGNYLYNGSVPYDVVCYEDDQLAGKVDASCITNGVFDASATASDGTNCNTKYPRVDGTAHKTYQINITNSCPATSATCYTGNLIDDPNCGTHKEYSCTKETKTFYQYGCKDSNSGEITWLDSVADNDACKTANNTNYIPGKWERTVEYELCDYQEVLNDCPKIPEPTDCEIPNNNNGSNQYSFGFDYPIHGRACIPWEGNNPNSITASGWFGTPAMFFMCNELNKQGKTELTFDYPINNGGVWTTGTRTVNAAECSSYTFPNNQEFSITYLVPKGYVSPIPGVTNGSGNGNGTGNGNAEVPCSNPHDYYLHKTVNNDDSYGKAGNPKTCYSYVLKGQQNLRRDSQVNIDKDKLVHYNRGKDLFALTTNTFNKFTNYYYKSSEDAAQNGQALCKDGWYNDGCWTSYGTVDSHTKLHGGPAYSEFVIKNFNGSQTYMARAYSAPMGGQGGQRIRGNNETLNHGYNGDYGLKDGDCLKEGVPTEACTQSNINIFNDYDKSRKNGIDGYCQNSWGAGVVANQISDSYPSYQLTSSQLCDFGDDVTGYCLIHNYPDNRSVPEKNGKYKLTHTYNENYLSHGEPGLPGEIKSVVIRSFDGKDLTINVGRGGSAGVLNSGDSGLDGSPTSMGDIIRAKGGTGGRGNIIDRVMTLPAYDETEIQQFILPATPGGIPMVQGLTQNLMSYILPMVQDKFTELFNTFGHGGRGAGVQHNCWAGENIIKFEEHEMSGSVHADQLPENCNTNYVTDDDSVRATDGTDGALMIRW